MTERQNSVPLREHSFDFVENHKNFHFLKLPEKNRASKDFQLHPRNFSDTIKVIGGNSPIYMTFYSTQR